MDTWLIVLISLVGLAVLGIGFNFDTKVKKTICVILGVVIIASCPIIAIVSGFKDAKSHSGSDRKCKVCGEVYSDSSNTRKIASSGMCNKCYNEYEWRENAKKAEEEYKKNK